MGGADPCIQSPYLPKGGPDRLRRTPAPATTPKGDVCRLLLCAPGGWGDGTALSRDWTGVSHGAPSPPPQCPGGDGRPAGPPPPPPPVAPGPGPRRGGGDGGRAACPAPARPGAPRGAGGAARRAVTRPDPPPRRCSVCVTCVPWRLHRTARRRPTHAMSVSVWGCACVSNGLLVMRRKRRRGILAASTSQGGQGRLVGEEMVSRTQARAIQFLGVQWVCKV